MNIVGPIDSLPLDCRLAITTVDYFNKWPEVQFVARVTAQNITKFLLRLFSRERYLDPIISDHGPQFQPTYFQLFLNERGILHRQSAIYHAQANGQVERFNRMFKDFLQVSQAIKGNAKWKLEEFLGIYRNTPHAAMKPFQSELFHNRRICTRLDVSGFPYFDKDHVSEHRKMEEWPSKTKTHTDLK